MLPDKQGNRRDAIVGLVPFSTGRARHPPLTVAAARSLGLKQRLIRHLEKNQLARNWNLQAKHLNDWACQGAKPGRLLRGLHPALTPNSVIGDQIPEMGG